MSEGRHLHTHERGDGEAGSAGLIRASSIEDALEVLQVETPSGRLFSSLLAPAWEALREAGLPVGRNPRLAGVRGGSFVQGVDGSPELAEAEIMIASDVEPVISAHVEIRALPEARQRVLLTSVRRGEQQLQPQVAECPSALQSAHVSDIDERIGGLRAVIEGES